MSGRRAGRKNQPHYQCWRRYRYLKDEKDCNIGLISAKLIDDTVYCWLVSLTANQAYIDETIDGMVSQARERARPLQNQLAAANRNLEEIERRSARLIERLADEDDDDIAEQVKQHLKAMANQKHEVESERDNLRQQLEQDEWLLSEDASGSMVMTAIATLLNTNNTRRIVERLDVRGELLSKDKIKLTCRIAPKGSKLRIGETPRPTGKPGIHDSVVIWEGNKDGTRPDRRWAT